MESKWEASLWEEDIVSASRETLEQCFSARVGLTNLLKNPFDGDTCSLTMVYGDESLKEIKDHLNSKAAWVDPRGWLKASTSIHTLELVLRNMTTDVPSKVSNESISLEGALDVVTGWIKGAGGAIHDFFKKDKGEVKELFEWANRNFGTNIPNDNAGFKRVFPNDQAFVNLFATWHKSVEIGEVKELQKPEVFLKWYFDTSEGDIGLYFKTNEARVKFFEWVQKQTRDNTQLREWIEEKKAVPELSSMDKYAHEFMKANGPAPKDSK